MNKLIVSALATGLILIVVGVWAPKVGANQIPGPPNNNPYKIVGDVFRVPPWLLYSVCKVESGLNPFALNYKKRAYMFSTIEEASNFLSIIDDNVDVGLGQVNCRIWCQKLGVTKYQLLDPWVNLSASAQVLSLALGEFLQGNPNPTPRDFWRAVGAYHSRTNIRNLNYSWGVFRVAQKTFGK